MFGFFTSIPWTTPDKNNLAHLDNTAYMFSLSKNTKHSQFQKREKAIRHYKFDYIFVIGNGDLGIREHFTEKSNNWSYFGGTYEPPEGMSKEKTVSYLAGS